MSEDIERIDPETGAVLRRGERPITVEYGGLSTTVTVPGWYPEGSDDGILNSDDMKVMDEALHMLKARARDRSAATQASGD